MGTLVIEIDMTGERFQRLRAFAQSHGIGVNELVASALQSVLDNLCE